MDEEDDGVERIQLEEEEAKEKNKAKKSAARKRMTEGKPCRDGKGRGDILRTETK